MIARASSRLPSPTQFPCLPALRHTTSTAPPETMPPAGFRRQRHEAPWRTSRHNSKMKLAMSGHTPM